LISENIIVYVIFLFGIWCWCKNKCLHKTFHNRCFIVCDECRRNFFINLYNNRWTNSWITINLTNFNMTLLLWSSPTKIMYRYSLFSLSFCDFDICQKCTCFFYLKFSPFCSVIGFFLCYFP
jgi:hypothetical protein